MIRRLNFLLPLLVVAVVGCGETKTVTSTTTSTVTTAAPRASAALSCQPDRSFAGCSATGQVAPNPGRLGLAPIGGPEFPDVSSWQGHPDWGQVFAWQRSHGWPTGGFFKLGEYHTDPDAAYNAAQLAGHFHAAYWFLRDIGCQHEADLIIAAARQLGVHFVWLDAEVAEARGYSACLLPKVKAAGINDGVYTGPGTWTGDNVPSGTALWDAAYNFHGPEFAGLWRNTADCWQFTDGAYAARTNVPGIGYDDVNVDMGCIKLVGGGTPPPPVTIMDTTVRTFRTAHGIVRASEDGTWKAWVRAGCVNPVQRDVCKSSRFHASLLRDRLYSVVQHYHGGSFNWDHARGRFYRLSQIQTSTKKLGS